MSREPVRPLPVHVERRLPAAGAADDCFADEIAIDFPSVGHAIERMREAFLGEEADATVLATELRLSTTEARRGLVVPLEVPMRSTCASCGGRGGTWREECDRCAGAGESLHRHHVRISLPPGVPNGARFRFQITSPHAAVPVRVELRVAVRSAA